MRGLDEACVAFAKAIWQRPTGPANRARCWSRKALCFRSYLGKAWSETHQTELASPEIDVGKEA